MLKNIFFVLMMAGCGKHQIPTQPNGAGLLGFAGENFSSTNSTCLDGMLAVIDHSCAVPMQIDEGYPYVMIQCVKVRDGAHEWNKYNIIAVTNPNIEDPPGATMLCVDPYARLYVQQRP